MLTFFRFFVKMNDTDRNVMSFNSHTFDPKGSFHNKSEMVGLSAWCHIGDKTLHGWVLMHDQKCRLHSLGQNICGAHAKSLSLAWNKLRLCSTNHRRGCFGNLACDLLSIVWTYSRYRKRVLHWCDMHRPKCFRSVLVLMSTTYSFMVLIKHCESTITYQANG